MTSIVKTSWCIQSIQEDVLKPGWCWRTLHNRYCASLQGSVKFGPLTLMCKTTFDPLTYDWAKASKAVILYKETGSRIYPSTKQFTFETPSQATWRKHSTGTATKTRITKFSVFPCELPLTVYFSKGNANLRGHQRQTALLKVPLHLAVTSQLRACVQVSRPRSVPPCQLFQRKCVCAAADLCLTQSLDFWVPFCHSDPTLRTGHLRPSNRSIQ